MPEPPAKVTDELLSAAVDDALTAAERARVEALLEIDPSARRQVETFGRIKRMVRSALATARPTPDLTPLLHAAMATVDAERAAGRQARPRLAPGQWAWRFAPALAVGLGLFGFTVVNLPFGDGSTRTVVRPTGYRDPADGEWLLSPSVLAAHHARWVDLFRLSPMPEEALIDLTSRLEAEVGYPVLEPDRQALGAEIYAGLADSGAAGSGRLTAVLLLRRDDGGQFSLVQFAAPDNAVVLTGFTPLDDGRTLVADENGTHLAYWSREWLHVCLASTQLEQTELAALAPVAVSWEQVQQSVVPMVSPAPTARFDTGW